MAIFGGGNLRPAYWEGIRPAAAAIGSWLKALPIWGFRSLPWGRPGRDYRVIGRGHCWDIRGANGEAVVAVRTAD